MAKNPLRRRAFRSGKGESGYPFTTDRPINPSLSRSHCCQPLKGVKILKTPSSYLVCIFSGSTSWSKKKHPEYSTPFLGAEIQKLSFFISRDIFFSSTSGNSTSIFSRFPSKSWDSVTKGLNFVLSIRNTSLQIKIITEFHKIKEDNKGLLLWKKRRFKFESKHQGGVA